ncbi:F-box domain-containing protein [Favolaschia claudopus]|uniref:F-box domain-containing protein n=1 Tax=Favolaschia claudopus TaxID=2862362 RepID=A0AAW0CKR7_9AGAR
MGSAPWLFTRICRFWAAVALATPVLWSNLDLHLDGMGRNGAIPLAQLQIQRSQNIPLTVTIRHSSNVWIDSHPLLDVALSASERWSVADIHMNPILLQEMAKGHRFQSLTTLDIFIDLSVDDRFDHISKFDDAFWSAFSLTPKLTHLRALSWDWSYFITPPFILPWAQLTRLTTSFTSNTEALTVLGKLSNVTECALTSILDFLETPSLTSLAVYGAGDADTVLSFVVRSRCANSLTSLQLRSSTINHDTALCLTEKLSSVTSLELGDFHGKLLSRSSTMSIVPAIPHFVRAFIDQWLSKRKSVTDLPPLNLLLTDKALPHPEDRKLTSLLSPLRKTGLVVTVSQAVARPDIMGEPFLY